MKQLPETVMPKMQREKGMLRIVVLVMCIFVGIVVLRFFVYFPSAKDSIVFGVGSCIIHGVYAIGALFLPLLNKQNTKRSIAQKYSKYRKKIKWIVKILSVLLIVSFIYVFAYVFPRSFAPRIVEGDYKSHDVTKADPTDIKVIVETNLTVEAVYLKDNEVREVCIRDYKQNGIRRIFSTVLVFDAEDNNEHVITVSVRAGNDKEIIDEKELPGLYNPGKYRTAGDGSTNPTPTFKPTLSPTPTPIIKGQSELEIVCIPRKKLETEEGIREFCSYIDSASIIKLVEIYSELVSSE